MNNKSNIAKYFWQVTYAHTIAWFIAGVFAVFVMNYEYHYQGAVLSIFMRPTNDPIVYLGMFLQIFRGLLVALFILPLRKEFFEEKYGLIKLGVITVGLFYVCTFGPGLGSFDGFIFTSLPVFYHLLGIPEMLLYTVTFIGILHISRKYGHKKIVNITAVIVILLISINSIFMFMSTTGMLPI